MPGWRSGSALAAAEAAGQGERLVEVGAYVFLLEIEQIRLADLTVHHLA